MTTSTRSAMDLRNERRAIDTALESLLEDRLATAPRAIVDPIRYAVLAPGKRVRPLLVLAAHRALAASDHDREALTRLACSVELVHAYSLVHDDLPCMDDDELRRGRPTLHVEFSEHDAVLTGAALMPLAVEVLTTAAETLGLDDAIAARLVRTLTAAAGGAGMVGGQLLDLRAERHAVSVSDLDRIHEGKTARLIQAACLMGGLAARATSDDLARLARFGLALGLAFQVVDDILDVTGSAQSMGKTGGRDAELGKAAYPNVVGLEAASERAESLVGTALSEIAPFEARDGLEQIARLVIERET